MAGILALKWCYVAAEGFRDSGIGSQGIKNSLAVSFSLLWQSNAALHSQTCCQDHKLCVTICQLWLHPFASSFLAKQAHPNANGMSVQMMVKTKTTVLNLRQPTYTMG
jgi:hypothetical protein